MVRRASSDYTKIKNRAKDIRLLIMDVDGVLTPGSIVMGASRQEIKFFDVHDGFGLMLWKRAGLKSAIITAGNTKAVYNRANQLMLDEVYQDARDKEEAYNKLMDKFKLTDKQACFIGDDLIDLPILKRVGFACCVSNASRDIMPYAHYVTKKEGGRGAVREVIDYILKSKGLWHKVTASYF